MTTYIVLPVEPDGFVIRARHIDGRLALIEGFRTFDEAEAWIMTEKNPPAAKPGRTHPSVAMEWQDVAAG